MVSFQKQPRRLQSLSCEVIEYSFIYFAHLEYLSLNIVLHPKTKTLVKNQENSPRIAHPI